VPKVAQWALLLRLLDQAGTAFSSAVVGWITLCVMEVCEEGSVAGLAFSMSTHAAINTTARLERAYAATTLRIGGLSWLFGGHRVMCRCFG